MRHVIPVLFVIVIAAFTAAQAQDAGTYTCPMHPHYVSSDPDGTCPICGMDLVPVAADPAAEGHGPGIAVSPDMIQTMGVRTVPAQVVPFAREVRAFGRVEPSTRLETVSASRIEGWIEDLAVSAEGDRVEEGELLYRVFSPDLVGAQQDFLAARRSGAGGRIEAAEQRLRSLGMQDAAIVALGEAGSPLEGVPVRAEADGVVSELSVRDGTYLRPGDPILRLQRYDEVWIIASVAEQDLPAIEEGTPVAVDVAAAAIPPRDARVDYVYPSVDPETRTGRVRIVLPNEEDALRPGAYADVSFAVADRPRLSVPSEAVLRDSRGAHVVTALGGGRFASRAVETGLSAAGRTEILSGLAAGEEVVVNGQFLLDSEASLREGFSKMGGASDAETRLSDLAVTAENLALLDHFVDAALYVHEALEDGYTVQPSYLDAAIRAGEVLRARYASTRLEPILLHAEQAVRAAQEAREPEDLRGALASLMDGLRPWLLEGAPEHYASEGLTLYEGGEGRFWLQQGGEPFNPYEENAVQRVSWPEAIGEPEMSGSSGHDH